MKYLIIGNGIAGTTAATNIRKFDENGEITIITDEDIPFYSRIRLTEYLSGEASEKKLVLHNDEWYGSNRINLITNKRVVSIEHAARRIVLEEGSRITYDKLLVATGSKPSVPPLHGIDKKGVFTLRTMADARIIREHAKNAVGIIILGGGVLGLEIGNALRKIGKSVTIIECLPRLLPKQMDAEGSCIFQEKLESFGLRFILQATADEILGNGSVEGLRLVDGKVIRGQMVVISAGISPATSLLNGSGISIGKGIPVNDRMQTELPDMFAAGDVAEHKNIIYGIWSAAEKQGEVAGINMAGGNTFYTGSTPSHSIRVAGIEMLSVGEIDLDCSLPCLLYKDKERGIYKKVVVKDHCIAGSILCGDTALKKEIMAAVKERRPVKEMKDVLERMNVTWKQLQK